ncbi:MAG: Gfo/Idh/MocA family oxidoreductase [Paracoccaceae bacterium]
MIMGDRKTKTPVRWGMVGGGKGSQIGYVHRVRRDARRLLQPARGGVRIDPDRAAAFGEALGLEPARCYGDYKTMFAAEAQREDGIRAVTIATPNNTHYAITKAALEHGLHGLRKAPDLHRRRGRGAETSGLVTRTGWWAWLTAIPATRLIEQARQMVASGALGKIRLVNMQFAHGFHSAPVEQTTPGVKWRVDPAFAGPSYVLAISRPTLVHRRGDGAGFRSAPVLRSAEASPKAARRSRTMPR